MLYPANLSAEFMVAEQVTHLSPTEEKVHAQLTFQAVDRALWAMTCASSEALAAEKLVADPDSVVTSREDFVLGMSDQIFTSLGQGSAQEAPLQPRGAAPNFLRVPVTIIVILLPMAILP